ncbi:putative DNA-binding protein [Streptococcus pneumoniae GA16531]|nr:putative DNA-binding protein [Streptococcus pneumoniae GA16531]
MREVIQELLDSSMSTSAISQGAGVPWTTVSDLRKGKQAWTKWHFSQQKNFMNLLQLISSDFDHCFYF